MGSIPLPALDIKPPQQPDMLGSFQKLMALRNMGQQQQLQQQQLVSGQQEQQLRQQTIQDQQATTAAMKAVDPTDPKYKENPSQYYGDLQAAALQHGASSQASMAIQQHGLTVQKTVSDIAKQDADTGSTKLKTWTEQHQALGNQIEGLLNLPDEQLHDGATKAVNDAVTGGLLPAQTGQQYLQQIQGISDPKQLRTALDTIGKAALGATNVANLAKTNSETRSDNANAALKEIEAKGLQGITPQSASQQVDSVFNPQNPQTAGQNRLLKSRVLDLVNAGDLPGAKAALTEGFQSALGIQKAVAEATNPAIQNAKVALAQRIKRAEQVITQGDPVTAGKLLADGSLTLSELKSRGTTPDFIVQATNAAQKANPGFNPQKAEADLAVAKSPANVAFFGSAKSLTDPGGTLDQLKAAGKEIPQNEFPVFNSLADVYKAQTGSGPVAKYAAILLGVADDYAKVTGGGAGTEGMQKLIMSLAPEKASPEQRDGAIDGFRGAVGSQTTSRIGNNTVLQKMYGSGPAKQQTQQAAATKTYKGQTYTQQSDGSWKLTQ
jgi:hypothetical protein